MCFGQPCRCRKWAKAAVRPPLLGDPVGEGGETCGGAVEVSGYEFGPVRHSIELCEASGEKVVSAARVDGSHFSTCPSIDDRDGDGGTLAIDVVDGTSSTGDGVVVVLRRFGDRVGC